MMKDLLMLFAAVRSLNKACTFASMHASNFDGRCLFGVMVLACISHAQPGIVSWSGSKPQFLEPNSCQGVCFLAGVDETRVSA